MTEEFKHSQTIDRAFYMQMDRLRGLQARMFGEEYDGDPVELRRQYAQAMLDLNAVMSEAGFATSQYNERWMELL